MRSQNYHRRLYGSYLKVINSDFSARIRGTLVPRVCVTLAQRNGQRGATDRVKKTGEVSSFLTQKNQPKQSDILSVFFIRLL